MAEIMEFCDVYNEFEDLKLTNVSNQSCVVDSEYNE